MASPLKRHAPNEFDDFDTENIDPLMFSSPLKKSRNFDFDMTKPSMTPHFTLTPVKKPAQYVERAQAAGTKRKAEESTITPINTVKSNQRVQPSSAPAPAGRSPKNKKIGILSRRRMTASPFTRVNPPTPTAETSNGLPFSIDAALAGTVPALKSKSKTKSTHRKSWDFEIHEDAPEEEMANLMEHSTCTLDISDDESRVATKADRDNKENIPPVDGLTASIGGSSQIAASRRDMMTDEPRSPLGDLDAKDFYAEGCDTSSIILIAAEDEAQVADEKPAVLPEDPEPCSPAHMRSNAVTESRQDWKEIIAQVTSNAATAANAGLGPTDDHTNGEAAEIQIWESESAKGDDDAGLQELVNGCTSHQAVSA